ncbi:MAG TPA: hypothetical protein VK324_03430 [Tepidisphaeraceae bacterium]|nr:hypothetical protein [Tepidisphaeraceae bacterium]
MPPVTNALPSRPVVVAAFEDRAQAERAVDELEAAGFDADRIGFALRGSDVARGGMATDAEGTKDLTGAAGGALTGGMVGGVLATAAALLVPGVGPIVAGGLLASFFGGAIAGTAVGGILGAMQGLGVSEDEAQHYERQFHDGKAIVAVRAADRGAEAADVLRRHGGHDVHDAAQGPIDTSGPFARP